VKVLRYYRQTAFHATGQDVLQTHVTRWKLFCGCGRLLCGDGYASPEMLLYQGFEALPSVA
jgi:hypothetical protein